MNSRGEYILADPFRIESGELTGVTPEKAFVLGVEWAEKRRILQERSPYESFTLCVHLENVHRIKELVESRRRDVVEIIGDAKDSIWVNMVISPEQDRRLKVVR